MKTSTNKILRSLLFAKELSYGKRGMIRQRRNFSNNVLRGTQGGLLKDDEFLPDLEEREIK